MLCSTKKGILKNKESSYTSLQGSKVSLRLVDDLRHFCRLKPVRGRYLHSVGSNPSLEQIVPGSEEDFRQAEFESLSFLNLLASLGTIAASYP